MDKDTRISIILPSYNESKKIRNTILDVSNFFNNKKINHQIILVDDGSTDNTLDIIKKNYPNIKIISHKKNLGKGAAVKTGVMATDGKYVLFMDADNDINISNFETFLPFLGSFDICIGSKRLCDKSAPSRKFLIRRFLSKIANSFIKILMGLNIKDTQCGFKCFDGLIAKKLFSQLKTVGWGFDIEILCLAQQSGYRIKELPVHWRYNKNTKVSFLGYIKTFIEILSIKAGFLNKKR